MVTSEGIAHPELDLACGCRSGRDLTEGGGVGGDVRIPEVRMIQCIEELGSKFHLLPLRKAEVFLGRDVDIYQTGTGNASARCRAEGPRAR